MIELWDDNALYLHKILAGHVRLVGGCVRDFLCNQPFSDRDMATTLTPDDVIARLEYHGVPYVDIGKDFGTVIAKVNGVPFEITTLRKDIKTDGRHAVVQWAKRWGTDAKRRDFTINALYADVHGRIYDYVGGLDDLRKNRLRFIGPAEQRIQEDFLRILRYFRFWGLMSQTKIPLDIKKAIQNHIQDLKVLSMDRRRDEMFKILCMPQAVNTLKCMENIGLMIPMITEIAFSRKQREYFRTHRMEKMLARFKFLSYNNDK